MIELANQPNFMLLDLWRTALAFSLYPLFFLAPGYVAGWLTNTLDFRQRSAVTRVLLSLTLHQPDAYSNLSACPLAALFSGLGILRAGVDGCDRNRVARSTPARVRCATPQTANQPRNEIRAASCVDLDIHWNILADRPSSGSTAIL